MYLLVEEKESEFKCFDMQTLKQIETGADFSKWNRHWTVISGDLVFARDFDKRTAVVSDFLTGDLINELPLSDVAGITVFENKVFVWNIDNEVFEVNAIDKANITLTKLVTCRKDINHMCVSRNTAEKFVMVMETFTEELCILKVDNGTVNISPLKLRNHRLIGLHGKCLYMYSLEQKAVIRYRAGQTEPYFYPTPEAEFCWYRSAVRDGVLYALFMDENNFKPLEELTENDDDDSGDGRTPEFCWKLEIIDLHTEQREFIPIGQALNVWLLNSTIE